MIPATGSPVDKVAALNSMKTLSEGKYIHGGGIPTVTKEVRFAPWSETPFKDAPNKRFWSGIMAPKGFEPTGEFQTLYAEVADAVVLAAPSIISSNSGIKLLRADTVMGEIARPEYGLGFELDDKFIEDCLGSRGLCLPKIELDEVTYFALHLTEATHEEKSLFQAQLNGLDEGDRKRLLVN